MDVGTQISLDILLGAASGIVGAVGAYVKLKSRIDLAEAKNIEQDNRLNNEISDIRERKKEMNIALHKRIDDQDNKLNSLQKEVSKGHLGLEKQIAQMELRIVKEFQNTTEKLLSKMGKN